MRDPRYLIPSDVLRMLPVRLTHSQLYQIEDNDADFPKPIRLARKKLYPRTQIENWIARKFGENAGPSPNEKPSRKRPTRAPKKKRSYVHVRP